MSQATGPSDALTTANLNAIPIWLSAVPIDQVEKWYRALKKFYDMALDPEYLVTFKLQPGNIPSNQIRYLGFF